MSKFLFFSLYYTSFSPLWLSILFINIKSCIEKTQPINTEKYSIIVILVLWVITFISIRNNLCSKNIEGAIAVTLDTIQEEKSITSEYLLSYILPLFAFDFTRWDSVILFLIFFITLAYLCIKHNHFSVNIVLEILNYQVYTCTVKNDDNFCYRTTIISHRNLNAKKGEQIYLKSLNNEYKLDIY